MIWRICKMENLENIVITLIALSIFFIPAMALKAVIDDARMDEKK